MKLFGYCSQINQSEPMKRIEDVTLLYEISKTLNEHLDLKKSLYKVLDKLSISINMIRGTIKLLNPLTNEITIEVAHGISRTAVERVKYKLGEGITGKVIQTGHAVTIPKISQEPHFLNRNEARWESGTGKELVASSVCYNN